MNVEFGRGMIDWICTAYGNSFFPLAPKIEEILEEDFTHAVGNICRFSGHCTEFYSVGQHMTIGATWGLNNCGLTQPIPAVLRLAFALHDASEAYLHDIPRPVKRLLPGYKAYEERLENMIFDKYEIPEEYRTHPIIKEVDNRMLATEVRDNMRKSKRGWTTLPEPFPFTIVPWSPQEARANYAALISQLIAEVRACR